MGGEYSFGDTLKSVELFPRPSSDACSIPPLPQPRSGHSLSLLPGGKLVICGGSSDGTIILDSCISWVAGNKSWTPFHNTRCLPIITPHNPLYKHNYSERRSGHTAWTPPSLPNSIVLLGGGRKKNFTAEILPGIEQS